MSNERSAGALGFNRDYWEANYADITIMDGIYNAHRRADALKAIFDAEYVEISTLADFGFGLGYFLTQMVRAFAPHTVFGLEPSPHAFARVQRRGIGNVESTRVTLRQTDLASWCQQPHASDSEPFDLSICSSVFQYLSEREIEIVLPALARRTNFLYFSVVTAEELAWQRSELDYDDRFAIDRPRDQYRDWLRPHFTVIGNRLLESRVHFNNDTSLFPDLLFRF